MTNYPIANAIGKYPGETSEYQNHSRCSQRDKMLEASMQGIKRVKSNEAWKNAMIFTFSP